jgi:hypothetical protein
MKTTTSFAAVTLVTAALLASAPTAGAWAEALEKFSAFAVDLSNTRRGAQAQVVDIAITRWSTDEERRTLASALTEKGPDAFLEALQKTKPVGTLRTPDSLGYDLHYAHEVAIPGGGRRILIGTDRPIGFWESRNRPRSIDYPFTIIEMRLDAQGKGQGKMTVATKVTVKGDVVELENYTSEPVRLNEIKSHLGRDSMKPPR